MSSDPDTISTPEPATSAGRGVLWLKVLRAFIIGPLIIVGWIAIGLWSVALVAERTGTLNRILTTEVARRLGPVADDFQIARTEVDWLERTVRLIGVSSGPGGRDVYIEELMLLFGWDAERGPRVERVELNGGSLRISRALMNGIQGLMNSREPSADDQPLPTFVVHSLLVEGETPKWGDLQGGQLDACLRPAPDGVQRLAGRLLPPGSSPNDPGGEIYLSGELDREGVLFMRAAARGLHLSSDRLPSGTPLEELRSLSASTVLDLEATGRFDPRKSLYPTFETRLTLSDGQFEIPLIDDPNRRSASDARLELRTQFKPGPSQALWDLEAWHGSAHFGVTWGGHPADAWLLLGRDAAPGYVAEAWIDVPRVEADESIGRLTDAPIWKSIIGQFSPHGTAGVSFAARLPDPWEAPDGLGRTMERCFTVRGLGEMSVAYHGLADRQTGVRAKGFPMRVSEIDGEFVYAFHPEKTLPEQMGFVGLRGRAAGGDVRVDGFLHARPRWFLAPDAPLWMSEWEFYLAALGDNVAVGPEIEGGLIGLGGVLPPSRVWGRYGPRSGHTDFEVELWHNTMAPGLATHVALDLNEVDLRWSEFPIELTSAVGQVEVWADGRPREAGTASWAVAVDAHAEADATTEPVAVRARVRGQAQPPSATAGAPDEGQVSFTTVQARAVNIGDAETRRVLGQEFPDALVILNSIGAAGFVDMDISHVQAPGEPATRATCEIRPGAGGMAVRPAQFPMSTRDLQGRTLLVFDGDGSDAPPALEVQVGPLLGTWTGLTTSTPIAADGHFPADGPGRLKIASAGLETTNRRLLDSIQRALSEIAPDLPVDPSEAGFIGQLDVSTIVELDGASSDFLDLSGYLRSGVLGEPRRPILRDLRGHLRVNDGVLRSDHLRAVLGSTPVELTDFQLRTVDGTTVVRTYISAKGMPLDQDHLSSFVDAETLSTLLDDLHWGGKIDIESGRLDVTQVPGGTPVVRFRGKLRVSSMDIDLGLPISVQSAEVTDLDLTFENDTVRALAHVSDLYCQIAGHQVERASLLATLVEPHLSIQELEGQFQGGSLRSRGQEQTSSLGASLFSIDLVPPFPFRLSFEVDRVDVGQLLAGIFKSDFANEGRVKGAINLAGTLDTLIGIHGSGYATLSDSALWSIPVFQDLFSQLGFETSATFKEMGSQFTVDDGTIRMTNMRVKSDLLSLVGEGSFDLEGRLDYDLEVRYSLVDRLGPLTRLVYWVQNSLLRISIRGDMSRPKVILKGILSRLVAKVGDGPPELPLPGYSALPDRF
ncbi:MAG: hypothetical protein ACI8QZ_002260 [Chlamydiales bacterium]|jgi:hypothetical protein